MTLRGKPKQNNITRTKSKAFTDNICQSFQLISLYGKQINDRNWGQWPSPSPSLSLYFSFQSPKSHALLKDLKKRSEVIADDDLILLVLITSPFGSNHMSWLQRVIQICPHIINSRYEEKKLALVLSFCLKFNRNRKNWISFFTYPTDFSSPILFQPFGNSTTHIFRDKYAFNHIQQTWREPSK